MHYKKINQFFVLWLMALVLISCKAIENQQLESKKPNFIIMMVDDMGFSDPTCYGGDVETPNFDRLAEEGLRFTRFYNCSRCSPTRASLLTGKYPHKVGLWRNGRSLSEDSPTVAEVLKEAGYQTGMVGKWHLSKSKKLNNSNEDHQKWLDHQVETQESFGSLPSYPVNRGFDKHYGVIWGVIDYFDPFSLVRGTEPVTEVEEDFYITDAITDEAIQYINEFKERDNPFFLYIAHTAPHWPLHAKPEDMEKYKGKFDAGWEKMRDRRYAKQLALGLFDAQNCPLPANMGGDCDALSEAEKAFQAAKMEAHAGMVDCVDQGLGRILESLEKNGELDNTFILFLSDNGASPETPATPGYDRSSMTRAGDLMHYEKAYLTQKADIQSVGSELSYLGIGRAWANAASTPYRFWKKESFEGGNNAPCIIRYPARFNNLNGDIIDQPMHVMDIVPTVLALAEVPYPASFNQKELLPLDGKNIIDAVNEKRPTHDTLFFEHEGGRAVQTTDWKLVSKATGHKHKNKHLEWELYNISKDRTEMFNVATEYPEIVQALARQWEIWWEEMQPMLI